MLIGVDWGTTNLRAYLIGPDGPTDSVARPAAGLMHVAPGAFEATLREAIAPLREKAVDAPVLMSGMVGSRQGWVEAPYVDAPADLGTIARQLIAVDAPTIGGVSLVPGVSMGAGGTWADVMRGEETEIFGALAVAGGKSGTFVLPGTHSKWVTVEGGAIVRFATYMTGDLFAAARTHTILSKFDADADDTDAFEAGLDMAKGLSGPGAILARLFTIRAEILMGRLGDDATASALSGLLIGAELLSGSRGGANIAIVGASPLAHRYARAAQHYEIDASVIEVDVAPRGHAMIAHARAAA